MEKSCYVCIDVGGTAIKYGVAGADGALLTKGSLPTERKIFEGELRVDIVDKIRTIMTSCGRDFSIGGAAVSTAGIVDAAKGSIVYALPDTLPGYTGTPLKDIVEAEFSVPCWVENDVNCAALGEMWLGAGRNRDSLFCITVGTSIGGCGIIGRKLICGACGAAGEIANMRISKGLLHELASATRLIKDVAAAKNMTKAQAAELNGEKIFAWAKEGDADAEKAVYNLAQNLADGIANVAAVLNPEIFILGGGIMAQREYLRPLIDAAVKERMFAQVYENTEIAFAQLGNDAGMLGALYNFLSRRTRG